MKPDRAVVLLLSIIALGLLSLALDFAQPVLMPLIIALLFSFMLAPVVEALKRIRVPNAIAMIIVIAVILGLFFLIGLFFYTSFQSFVRIFPRYQSKFQRFIDELSMSLFHRYSIPPSVLGSLDWSSMVRGYLLSLSGTFMEFVKGLFIITIFLIFLLLERPFLRAKLEKAFEAPTSLKIGLVIDHINQQIGRYLGIKFVISAATGFIIWLSLYIIGLDFPIIWGFLGFLLNFIPSIGSTLHFVITVFMSFVQFYPDSVGKMVAVIIAMLTIQTVIGNFLDPRLQGHRLDLSPFIVLFSLIYWGWLWGVVGMLLATPIAVALKIICENIPMLRSVGVLMGRGYDKRPPRAASTGEMRIMHGETTNTDR